MNGYKHYKYENDSYYRYLAIRNSIDGELLRTLNTDGVKHWL